MYLEDNYDRWKEHEEEKEFIKRQLPRCSHCNAHITSDEAYYIYAEWVCEDCIGQYLKTVEREDF